MDEDEAVSQQGSLTHAEGVGAKAASGRSIAADTIHGLAVTGDYNIVYVNYQGAQVLIPSPDAVAAHRAALCKRLEEHARERWGGMSIYIQEEGAALPIEVSPYETGRLGVRQNLLGTLHAADRLLVLGEPGSGKTVALERLAWELCSGPEPAIPVLVRLFHYAGTPLREWVRARLRGTGNLRLDDDRALAAFLEEGGVRCFFLFDGLNEVAPPHRAILIDELVRWCDDFRGHPVVLTSRAQDELWRRLRNEVGQVVVVQPIAGEQAMDYLVAHLGPEKGCALYDRLDPYLREMACMPLILWLVKEAGAAGESVPGNRGELYARFVSRLLGRDTERQMDVEIPERVKRQALADLAFHLGQDQRLTCPRDEAVRVVAREQGEGQAESIVGACARHGLLAGEETVWFAPHQTVQEHFGALALRERAQEEWQAGVWRQLGRSGRHLLTRRPQGVGALAADEWWTETFVQLAGLVDDADRLARDVARVNPWLGWWCVAEGRAVSQATRLWVEDRSTRLLRSERVADRRRAVLALVRMRTERTAGPLIQSAGDADREIAGLAVQALLGLGEAVWTPIISALETTDPRRRLAALRYLATGTDDSLCAEMMRTKGAVRPLIQSAGDADREIAGLAVQALLGLGEAVWTPIMSALETTDPRRRLAALRYLATGTDDPLCAEMMRRERVVELLMFPRFCG